MTPTVSVVMAAKNYARFLLSAVESVLAQTVADWELLVVDDGSTDDTPAAVRPYLADRRVRYVRADRLGVARAKSLGVRLSHGEYVAFLDADDVWRPTKLAKQLAVFGSHPAAGVVHCRRALIDEAGRPLPGASRPPFPRGWVLPELFVDNFVCFSAAVVRRRVFDHVGGFDPSLDLSVDYDLWLRVAKHYEFEAVDEELVLYRTGHGNLSKRLADRAAVALSVAHRAETRYGMAGDIPADVRAEGFASTCRTVGYVMRPSDPWAAVRWYWEALRHRSRRPLSAKGLVASAAGVVRPRRPPAAAENAAANG